MLKITGGYRDIPMPDKEPTAQELLKCKAQMDPWQGRPKVYSGLLPIVADALPFVPRDDRAIMPVE